MTNNNSFHIYAVSIIMSAFSLVCPSSIFAVERNDSSTTENKEQNVKELKEVVVEGRASGSVPVKARISRHRGRKRPRRTPPTC